MFTIAYDGDFKPYIVDLVNAGAPWFNALFLSVWVGFKGAHDPGLGEFLLTQVVGAEFFYASHPDVTRRDILKMQKLSKAVGELLDAAS
jgi:hypothetical protein